MDNVANKIKITTDMDKKSMYEKLLSSLTVAVENLEKAVKSGENNAIEEAQQHFIKQSKDPLSIWLDSKLGQTVENNVIFNTLPRFWEEEFHKDMDALNVWLWIFNFPPLLIYFYLIEGTSSSCFDKS